MNKELHGVKAWRCGRDAAKNGLPFDPYDDVDMYDLIFEKGSRSGYACGKLNMGEWYLGYLDKKSSWDYGINEDLFTAVLEKLLPDCNWGAFDAWINFAKECVESKIYVPCKARVDKIAPVQQWLDAFLCGLWEIKIEFGTDAATTLCELGQKERCIFPREMRRAAECLRQGGNIERIQEMRNAGELDEVLLYSPQLFNIVEKGLDYIMASFFNNVPKPQADKD